MKGDDDAELLECQILQTIWTTFSVDDMKLHMVGWLPHR
jgi:hypothetical protein